LVPLDGDAVTHLSEGEVHANLGRFFFLEGRLPLGTYHLSKERGEMRPSDFGINSKPSL
jgi:hypothetical protein